MVKISLPKNNKTIIASKYQLYLPTEEQLINEILNRSKKNRFRESEFVIRNNL